MKRIVSAIAAALALAAFVVPCEAAEISAESAIVYEAVTGEVLFERAPDEKMQMASTTKIMTALVVMENCALDEEIIVKPEWTGIEGSSAYIKAGEKIRIETLLYGLMLASGNDAATALACHTAGSVPEFAALMNARAKSLGCENTNFVNPHGLDAEGHYSTARDLALITAEAMKNETFRRIVSTTDISIGGRYFKNHNKLLTTCEGCVGVKTGYTKSSGRSLVSCVERNGMRLICVTLKAPDDWDDHKSLYEECTAYYKTVTLAAGEYRYPVTVVSGKERYVYAKPRDSFCTLVKADAAINVEVDLNKFTYAPVAKGEVLGQITLTADGEELFSTEITAEKSVDTDEEQMLTFEGRIKRMLANAIDGSFGKMGYKPEG